RRLEDRIDAARIQGAASLLLGDLKVADERLHYALTHSRACNLVEGELPSLVNLADLRHCQGRTDEARDLLDQVWEPTEIGPFPLAHADALNLLARIECDAGHREAAIAAATEAYRKAWCDGPPYAYHWGLQDASQLLGELGAPEPKLSPFDPSRYPPMPEVEIAPPEDPAADIADRRDNR